MERSRLRIGLRGQQIVLFLLVALMPLFAVSLVIKILGENALKESVGESLVLLAQEKLARADGAIAQRIANIQAELPNIQQAVARSNTADGQQAVFFSAWERLEDSIRLFETYAGYKTEVTVANASGYVLRSNNRQLDYNTKKGLPYTVRDKKWWQSAYNNGIGYPFVEDVIYDDRREIYLLPIALPIQTNSTPSKSSSAGQESETIGVLRTVVLLPELATLVESQHNRMGAYAFLTNGSGKIIAASSHSGYRIGNYIDMNDAVEEAIIEGKKGIHGKYYDYESHGEADAFDEPRVYGWARTRPVDDEPWKTQQNFSNWMLFISRPTSSAYAGVVRLNRYTFYLTIASSGIVVIIACWAAQRIAKPILEVAQAADNIGQGEFDSEILVESDDEVGVLAEKFNEMRRNLKTAVDKLRHEERKLTTIVENLGEGLIVVEPGGRVLYVNPVAERLLNLGRTAGYQNFITIDTKTGTISWTKRGMGDASTTADTKTVNLKILSALQREMQQHQTMIAEIGDGNRKKGETRVLRIIASQFRDEYNNIAGMVYVFDDITHEHEIEQMKSEFVSLVSHELRTPLTSIVGFISLILDGKTGKINQKQYESLSRAHRQSKRLAALINDLLDISRIEAGRIEMKREPIEIDWITKRRIEELRPQADEKDIHLLLDAQPDLPLVIADADRIGQVFINLIGNAIKFTPDSGKVTVKISKSLQNGRPVDGIHVEVIDTGLGIPAEEREKVFDKFQQLRSTRTQHQGGTGLGLSIASGIIEAHGGKIWVEAGDNEQGCNFQFFIPIGQKENG